MSVDRAIRLGNRLLAACRDHVRLHRLEPNATTDPLFALSYVAAEFIAAASHNVADIDEAMRIHTEIVRDRAIEALEAVHARRTARKQRMN